MDEIVRYSALYDIYSNLLTEKQQAAFEDYYFENLTIEEIAEKNEVSKNAISKQIKAVKKELDNYESKLRILFKREQLLEEFKYNVEVTQKILNIID